MTPGEYLDQAKASGAQVESVGWFKGRLVMVFVADRTTAESFGLTRDSQGYTGSGTRKGEPPPPPREGPALSKVPERCDVRVKTP